MAIDPNIILAGQQQPNTLSTAANGIQFGQGMRQLLALRQIGNMQQLDDANDRKQYANNSMFSRELNNQLKVDDASKQKQMYEQLKAEADIAKISSEATKNNAQAGGFTLDNSQKKFGAISGAFQSAAMSGDKGQVLLGLDALQRTGVISPEDYAHQYQIVKAMQPDEIKQYALGIGLNNKDVAPYLYQTQNNVADNLTSNNNNIRTTQASIYSTDVGAATADKNRAQQDSQFQQNYEYRAQQDEIKNGQAEVREVGGKAYIVYKNGDYRPFIGVDGQQVNSVGKNNQQEEVQRLQRVDTILPEIEKILPQATNSYLGAGVDMLGGAFGISTDGAQATAQLKTLAGQLVSLMPKMSGPQSDKDVAMYKEMAGNLGDQTIPVKTRLAALQTIRELNEKYKAQNQQNNPTSQALAVNSYSFMP